MTPRERSREEKSEKEVGEGEGGDRQERGVGFIRYQFSWYSLGDMLIFFRVAVFLVCLFLSVALSS